MKYIISVLCPDCPGIVSRISNAVFQKGGNISDMSQTVLKGYFIGVAHVIFDREQNSEELEKFINPENRYKINIVPFCDNDMDSIVSDRYILTVRCNEQKGIVASVTDYLYHNNINIESFSAFTENDEFVIVAEISVPEEKATVKIKNDIKKLGEKWNISVHLSHENIYLATNTVCPTVRIGKN